MKKGIKAYQIIGVFILVIILLILLIILNINSLKNKDSKTSSNPTTITMKKTTTAASDNYSTDKSNIELTINGEKELISMKTYVSYLGFQIDYMSDYFIPTTINNGIVMITSKEDSNTYIKIEPLEEELYYYEYNNDTEEIIEGYTVTHEFYKGNGNYIKVTTCINNDNTNNIDKRISYMMNTLYFN